MYNISSDPHEDIDIAGQYPEVVAKMSEHLDNWWEDVKEDANTIHRVTIGSSKENPIMLSACDWYNIFVDQQKQVRKGDKKSGYWHVEVDRQGTYEFEMRRWPIESGYGLNDAIDVTQVTDGKLPKGKAFNIAGARIKIGDQEKSTKVYPNDKSARFTFALEAGKNSIITFFDDVQGKRILGAYYLYVKRIGK